MKWHSQTLRNFETIETRKQNSMLILITHYNIIACSYIDFARCDWVLQQFSIWWVPGLGHPAHVTSHHFFVVRTWNVEFVLVPSYLARGRQKIKADRAPALSRRTTNRVSIVSDFVPIAHLRDHGHSTPPPVRRKPAHCGSHDAPSPLQTVRSTVGDVASVPICYMLE